MEKMCISFKFLVLSFIIFILSGCAATRLTTSEKTAVEQALLSQSIERNLQNIKIPKGLNRLVYIDSKALRSIPCGDKSCFSVDTTLAYNFIIQKLLKSGYRITKDSTLAELFIHPRIEFVGIDDSDSLLGFPSIPIPLPGVGTIQTPEVSLFGSKKQHGRAKFNILATDAKEGSLVFSETARSKDTYYNRWNAFFVFDWRTTNLGKPF